MNAICSAVSDGQADQAMGDQEDCGIHWGGRADTDRLHLPEGGRPQPPTKHSERRRHGQYIPAGSIAFVEQLFCVISNRFI